MKVMYLGRIDEDLYEKISVVEYYSDIIKTSNIKNVVDEEISPMNIVSSCLHRFRNNPDNKINIDIDEWRFCKPFFENNKLQRDYSQTGKKIAVLPKDSFRKLIKELSKVLLIKLKAQKSDLQKNKTESSVRNLSSIIREIECGDYYDLGVFSMAISFSNTLQAELFELTHIYKSFDWENEKLILIEC